jgi:hypothetical protein
LASGNAVPVALSSGTNTVTVYDANNTAGNRISPTDNCGVPLCVARATGREVSCASVDAGTLDGMILGGGFPAMDTPAQDIATVFQFELRDPQ